MSVCELELLLEMCECRMELSLEGLLMVLGNMGLKGGASVDGSLDCADEEGSIDFKNRWTSLFLSLTNDREGDLTLSLSLCL